MGEAARTGGPAVSEHKRGPQEIRRDIEQTREELGDTVEALAAKTDVRARAVPAFRRAARGPTPYLVVATVSGALLAVLVARS